MNKSNIKIKCSDGFELAGTLYEPDRLLGAVMIAPATGIKKRFYHSFAGHLANQGYGVICYENRGIGESKNGGINKIDASLINWGRLDMPAVLNKLKHCFPNQSYHLIGHSAGGQLVGLMENTLELKSMFTFASSSGSLRNMSYPFKLFAVFYLNIFIPISNLFFGQTNSHWVGLGEPLPKMVAKQWRRWCNGTGYVATDFGKKIKNHLYDDLKIPSLWLCATDDGIANLANVKDMTQVFSQSEIKIKSINPENTKSKQIGHMGFFSSKNSELWRFALEWLDENK